VTVQQPLALQMPLPAAFDSNGVAQLKGTVVEAHCPGEDCKVVFSFALEGWRDGGSALPRLPDDICVRFVNTSVLEELKRRESERKADLLAHHSALQEQQTADAVRKRDLFAKKEHEVGLVRQARDTALRLIRPYASVTDAQATTAAQLERLVAGLGDWLRQMNRGNLSAQHALSDEESRVLEQYKEPHGSALDTFSALFELYLPCRAGWEIQQAERICAVVADSLRSESLKMIVAKTTETAKRINQAQPQLRVFNLDQNMPKPYPSGQVELAREFGRPIYYASSLVRVARHVQEAGGRALGEELMNKVFAKTGPLSNLLLVRNRDDALAYQGLCTQRRFPLRYTVIGYDDGFVVSNGGYIGGSGGKRHTKLDQLPRVNRCPHAHLAVRMVEPEDTRALAECQELVRNMHTLESSAAQTISEIDKIEAAMLARSREAQAATGEPLRHDPPPQMAANQSASRASGRGMAQSIPQSMAQSMGQSSSTRHRGAQEAGVSGSPPGKRTRSGPYVHELQ